MRFVGAGLLLFGGILSGYLLCRELNEREKMLSELHRILTWMEDRLRYRLTPLPELLSEASEKTQGELRSVLTEAVLLLESNRLSDCEECMTIVIQNHSRLPQQAAFLLKMLGTSMGQFDLTGQLNQLAWVEAECTRCLRQIRQEKPGKRKIYQTLGFCAGAALALLLI